MIGKILLADSGTGKSEEMLKMLLNIEPLKAASVTILNVVPSLSKSEEVDEKKKEGTKLLEEAAAALPLEASKVKTLLREGDPKLVVCQVADEIDADLIIMGSRGLRRLESILKNSVSQYVFQLSEKPMLLVKDDIFVKRINRVMVAYDGSGSAQYCLRLGLHLVSGISGGQLILAHAGSKKTVEKAEDDPVLAPAIAEAKKSGVTYRCYSSSKDAGPEICQLAEESNADLLILGSPDRRPSIAKSMPDLDRLLGKSISDYVRVNASCPVLLARQQD